MDIRFTQLIAAAHAINDVVCPKASHETPTVRVTKKGVIAVLNLIKDCDPNLFEFGLIEVASIFSDNGKTINSVEFHGLRFEWLANEIIS